MIERIDMRGAVTIELTDRSGAVVHREHRNNRIVLTGRQLVAGMFAGGGSGIPAAAVTHVGVGTRSDPPADNQTGLLAERGRSRLNPVAPSDYVLIQDMSGAAPVTRPRVSLTAVFDFNDANGSGPTPEPLREAALFTAGAGGTMYNRVVLEDVHKTTAFKLTVLWDIVF